MKNLKIIPVFCFLAYSLISCEKNEVNIDEALTFKDIEAIFEMKEPFSIKAKETILNRYGSLENYLEIVEEKRQQLYNKRINSESNSIAKVSYKVKLISPEYLDKLTIHVKDDETILDVAEQQGIDLPYSDRAGASSTCAALQMSGVPVDQSEQSFLDEDLLEAGYVLLCVAYPKSRCTMLTHQEDTMF
ncbi:2Fe-2S iron-sulfur cluster-binding protein [Psychroflexus tropicus]|uniref:2Fe-2S iron-sulfur cluster-binding protein n=1 Tax=Psychroflexus tropicus TaxID=197345 RepID=UPI0003689F55|nr:2Fe-2S iron-sulfur cluster-binding protein [Psychroflexus tropicus]